MKQQAFLLSSSSSSLCPRTTSLTFYPSISLPIRGFKRRPLAISAALESTRTEQEEQQQLSARERRQLRNQRRETRAAYNWKEDVETKLIKKPTKRFASWTDELNLDTLAIDGPQWWIVRVGRLRGQETADLVARLLVKTYPHIDFKVYSPAVQVKRRLKNGSISIKAKPLFPGCFFLHCLLDKELHDFIRECDGVGGFIGSKVGNDKKQINKPRPVSEVDMEAIFRKAKEEQETTDQAFEEEQKVFTALKTDDSSESATKPVKKSRRTLTKASGSSKKENSGLVLGSTIKVLSGTFAGFDGDVKKFNRRSKKVTVGFSLFGKETLVELGVDEVASEST